MIPYTAQRFSDCLKGPYLRASREHLLRIRELAQEFGCLSYTSLDPGLLPRPSAAALVRAIADGELELKRVRPPATPARGRSA